MPGRSATNLSLTERELKVRTIDVKRHIEAPRGDVWAVLADFPNITSWNGGVKKSFSTSDATNGVGAQRHCDLAPMGALEETVQVWEPEARMEISIDSAEGLAQRDPPRCRRRLPLPPPPTAPFRASSALKRG